MKGQLQEIVQDGYERFNRGDLEGVLDMLHTDVRWHIPGDHRVSGDYVGKQGVQTFFRKMAEGLGPEGQFCLEVGSIAELNDHAVICMKVHAERQDKAVDVTDVHVWHVRGGKISEFWTVSGEQEQLNAFWS